jgi:hypothetical protein
MRLLVVAAVLLAAGCSDQAAPHVLRPVLVSTQMLPAPPGRFVTVAAWLPRERRFVVEVSPRRIDAGDPHLYTMARDGTDLRALANTRERPCGGGTAEDGAEVRGRESVVYWSICFRSPRGDRRMRSLRVHNLRTGATSLFVHRYFRLFEAGGFSFARGGSGIISLGDRLNNRLYWLRAGQLSPVDSPIADAGTPVWSHDGRYIAVDGVPAGEGTPAPTSDDTWVLYVMNVATGRFDVVVDDLTDNACASWAPDGRRLAVAMAPRGAAAGIWLVAPVSGTRRLLLKGSQYGCPLWLPDERTLAVPVGGYRDVGYRGRYGTLLVTLRR